MEFNDSGLYTYSNNIGEQSLIFTNNQEYENTTEDNILEPTLENIEPKEDNSCDNLADAQKPLPNPIELLDEDTLEEPLEEENLEESLEEETLEEMNNSNNINGFDRSNDIYKYDSEIDSVPNEESEKEIKNESSCNIFKFLLYIGVLIVLVSLVFAAWDFFSLSKVTKSDIQSITGGSETDVFSLSSDSLGFDYLTDEIERMPYLK